MSVASWALPPLGLGCKRPLSWVAVTPVQSCVQMWCCCAMDVAGAGANGAVEDAREG